MKITFHLLILLLSSLSSIAQTYTLDLGNTKSTFNGTGTSTSFIPTPASGNSFVANGTGGVITIDNNSPANRKIGFASIIHASASSNSTPNKFGVYNFGASKRFYGSFQVMFGNANLAGANSGTWIYSIGNGNSFSNTSAFTNSDVFGAIRFMMGTNGSITASYRSNSSWVTIANFAFKQGNVYTIEILANNLNGASNSINYTYKSVSETLADDKYDVFVNGELVIDDASRNGLGTNSNIDSWMLSGESSTNKESFVYADNFVYSNAIASAYNTSISYFCKSTGFLNSLSSWTTNNDGTGDISPISFTKNYTNFYITNNFNATINNTWNVSGTGSKIAIGNGTDNTIVTIPSTFKINGTVDMLNNSRLVVYADSLPTLSSVDAGAVIEFRSSRNNAKISGTYTNLTITDTAALSMNADVIVNGNLTINNASLNLNGKNLTVNGALSGTIVGNQQSSLTLSGNTSIATLTFAQKNPGSSNRIKNLTINKGNSPASATVTLANKLEVTGVITLSNGTLQTSDSLVLISDANGTASISTIPSTADITGKITVQRYVPSIIRRYRTLSPNTSNFTFNELKDDILISGTGGSANGFDASGNNSSTIFTYQESTNGGRGWKAITSINQAIAAGQGALVFVRGDRTLPAPQWYTAPFVAQNEVTIDFNGPVNKGNIAPSITYTNTGVAANDGWNLIGNPYPSAIDWNLVTKTNISQFAYVFNPNTNAYVVNDGSTPIASGQAFFVQATATSPSVIFTETSKTSTTPTSYFKSGSTNRVTIKMIRDSLNSDIAWLRFVSGANINYSSTEDAIKFANSGINMGFVVPSNATNVQLNTVPPVTNIADTFVLFTNATAGNYTLSFSQLQNIPSGKAVLLKDLFTNTITDLKINPEYVFTITTSSAAQGNRFQLIIIDPSALPVSFLSVNAKATNMDATISWSTASEENNELFVVERSFDNKNFEEVGSLKGAGNSNQVNNYALVNEGAISAATLSGANTIYYRVKQVDFSGNFTYSEVVKLSLESKMIETSLSIYPNPANLNGVITINGTSPFETITISDISGTTVKTITANAYTTRIDLSGTAKGIYFISNSKQTPVKLIIQ